MAGNKNSGRTITFKYSDKELDDIIEKYKNDLENDVFDRASWPHFCSVLGCTEREVADVMSKSEDATSAYKFRGQALNRMSTWIRGQLLSGKGWGGQLSSKAIFALKQDQGDGLRYTDSDKDQRPQDIKIRVDFADGDVRSGKAGK